VPEEFKDAVTCYVNPAPELEQCLYENHALVTLLSDHLIGVYSEHPVSPTADERFAAGLVSILNSHLERLEKVFDAAHEHWTQ